MLMDRDQGDEQSYDTDRLDRMRERYAAGLYNPNVEKARAEQRRMEELKAACDAGYFKVDPDVGGPLTAPDTAALSAEVPESDDGPTEPDSLLARWWTKHQGR